MEFQIHLIFVPQLIAGTAETSNEFIDREVPEFRPLVGPLLFRLPQGLLSEVVIEQRSFSH